MFLISHALKNIVRNRGRYFLTGTVLTVCFLAVTVSAMIYFTAEAVIDDYAERFGARVYFTPDLRKLLRTTEPDENGMYYNPEITAEQYLAFSECGAVKATLFRGSRQTYGEGLTGLDQGGEEAFYASGGWAGFTSHSGESHDTALQRQAPNTVVIGFSDVSMMEDFILGLREVEEGHFFEGPGQCMVSRDFADLNGLEPGDSLELQDVNSTETAPLRLTVCGIYTDITAARPDDGNWAVNNRRNEILTGFSTLQEHGTQGLYVTAVYYLKNPALGGEFESYVREKGLHEVYNVNVDADSYNRVVRPVESLKRISAVFLGVVLAAGCLILVLISVLGVRERKYEIGVLRGAGMPKAKVALGLLYESVCVMVLCLFLGLGGGTLAAQPVSDAILTGQAESDYGNGTAGTGPGYGDILTSTETGRDAASLQEVKIAPEPESVLFVITVSLALGLLTNAAGILYIARYEPMRILWERS